MFLKCMLVFDTLVNNQMLLQMILSHVFLLPIYFIKHAHNSK